MQWFFRLVTKLLHLYCFLFFNQFILAPEDDSLHFKIASHRSALPYSSYLKDLEPLKAYYLTVLYACSSDEATYISVKGVTEKDNLMSKLIEESWDTYKKNDKNVIVNKSGIAYLNDMDQNVQRICFDILYGFKSKQEVVQYIKNLKKSKLKKL